MQRLPLLSLSMLLAACSDGGAGSASGGGSASSGGATTGETTEAGPVAVSSAESTSSGSGSTTSSTGGGGGDPGWTTAPWSETTCTIQYAQRPEEAFPRLEWAACPGGEPACEVLVKNWPPFTNTGQVVTGVRRVGDGHEIALFAVWSEGDSRLTLADSSGAARSVYRTLPSTSCQLSALKQDVGGHWIGAQLTGAPSTFVFQPEGEPPSAAQVAPLTDRSQNQDGGHGLFAIELSFAAAVKVFSRDTGQTYVSPPGGSTTRPRVTEGGVFFLRSEAVDQPTSWVWDRASGEFRSLIDVRPSLVGDVTTDGTTLAWMEVPPYDFERDAFPPGVLYTAPYTTDPARLVKTARWTDLPVGPAEATVSGAGYFAGVSESTRTLRILRFADGRRWSVPIPNDAFAAPVLSMPYIDETFLFLRVDTEIFRIRIQDLGEGMPSE